MKRLTIAGIATASLTGIAAMAATAVLLGQNGTLKGEISAIQTRPAAVVTRTLPPKTVTVTKKKTVYKTRTVYRDGYPVISDNPSWNCAGNIYQAYINLANGGPAGDTGLWNALCPGVPQPAN
jgi:hypothetical protein